MGQSMFWSEEHLANLSRSQESEADWMTRAATSHLNMHDWLTEFMPAGWFGRTCQGSLAPPVATVLVRDQISPVSSELSPDSISSLRSTDGEITESSPARTDVSRSPGQLLTLNGLEFRSDAVACLLSDILETGELPRRYFLTARACRGILNRAGKREKALPAGLELILRDVATRSGQSGAPTAESI